MTGGEDRLEEIQLSLSNKNMLKKAVLVQGPKKATVERTLISVFPAFAITYLLYRKANICRPK